MNSTPPPAPDLTTSPSRRRRLRRSLGIGGLVLLTAVGGTTAWALDRFVIEHVEIADVSKYEAEQQAATSEAPVTQAETGAEATEPATAEATASEENDESLADPQVTITEKTYGTGPDAATYYVADGGVSAVRQLRSPFPDDAFGQTILELPSVIAAENNATLAINGDYYGFRDTGIVIRNGVLYRDEPARQGFAIYSDGTMAVYDETTTTGAQLLADGVWQTISFGPALVTDGAVIAGIDQVEIDTNVGNHSIQGDQPRTAVGMIEANHFVFVVVDGRSDESAGVTLPELAEIMADLGATEAYNLDGGGSSTMISDGSLVNDPLGRGSERGTSDIFYIG